MWTAHANNAVGYLGLHRRQIASAFGLPFTHVGGKGQGQASTRSAQALSLVPCHYSRKSDNWRYRTFL